MNFIIVLTLCLSMSSIALNHSVSDKDNGMFLCKRLDTDFSMVLEKPKVKPKSANTNKPSPKPKPGPRGPPGPKGSKGKTGTISEKLIDEKISKRLGALEERIAYLEKMNQVEVKEEKKEDPCHVFYRNRCFIFIKKEVGTLDTPEAKVKCEELRGDLANIYDKAHFESIEVYQRELMTEDIKMVYFIVGMTYNQKSETVSLRRGAKASYVKWYSERFPSSDRDATQIQIQVNHEKDNDSGMYNTSPLTKAKSALCEIHPKYI